MQDNLKAVQIIETQIENALYLLRNEPLRSVNSDSINVKESFKELLRYVQGNFDSLVSDRQLAYKMMGKIEEIAGYYEAITKKQFAKCRECESENLHGIQNCCQRSLFNKVEEMDVNQIKEELNVHLERFKVTFTDLREDENGKLRSSVLNRVESMVSEEMLSQINSTLAYSEFDGKDEIMHFINNYLKTRLKDTLINGFNSNSEQVDSRISSILDDSIQQVRNDIIKKMNEERPTSFRDQLQGKTKNLREFVDERESADNQKNEENISDPEHNTPGGLNDDVIY